MEAQQHLNNQIIVNQPNFKKDNNNLQDDQANETDENDIVYLSMNDEEFMDDDEFVSSLFLFLCKWQINAKKKQISRTFFFLLK